MPKVFNKIVGRYLQWRWKHIDYFMHHPQEFQNKWFRAIIQKGSLSEYAQKYGLRSTSTYQEFSRLIPVVTYEDIHRDIERMMLGEINVLWPGQVEWFAKSSGTTNAKSKFIPISKENLTKSHIAASWETMAMIYHKIPEANMFSEKSLLVGGAIENFERNPNTKIGDVSAILINQMPGIGRPFYTPDFDTAVMPDWDKKLDRIVEISGKENVVMIGGVPTWNVVLIRKLLDHYKADNLLRIWPNLQVYVHGGVSFDAYRSLFKEFIPSEKMVYQEIYNASEGFFAIQDQLHDTGMLLMVDHGMYFEFLPKSEWHIENPRAITLEEVEEGIDYALVVTNNSGLWRYMPGDTIKFTSLCPYRIVITGRTKHFINVFGEEVMVGNANDALLLACTKHQAIVKDYTVAPIYLEQEGKGGHQWLIEFESYPNDMEAFIEELDLGLQSVNSDYQAKRYKDMALQQLEVVPLPEGSFEKWLRVKRTIGAQVKVPRLSNDRKVVEEILQIINRVDHNG